MNSICEVVLTVIVVGTVGFGLFLLALCHAFRHAMEPRHQKGGMQAYTKYHTFGR